MNRFKNILLFGVFPIAVVALAFYRLYLIMIPVIAVYFIVFALLQYENILKIITGYNSKKGRIDRALRFAYKAYKVKNSTVHTALMFIYLLLKACKYDKAGEIIEETVNKDMSEHEEYNLMINKALFLWKKNRIKESLAIYDELIKDGESTVLYGSYGYIATLGDDIEKALELNEKAYEYNNYNKAILDNLGLTYIKTGDFQKALEIYEELMNKDPQFPEAYYNMAELMQKMSDVDSAVRYMKKCMQMKFNGLSTITEEQAQKRLDQLMRLQGSLQ
jgi:tetratricopeptide (TPR) repeat protein